MVGLEISDEGQFQMLMMMLAMFFGDNVGDYDSYNRMMLILNHYVLYTIYIIFDEVNFYLL